MRALDFVKTPDGSIAMIGETNDEGEQASIWYIYRSPGCNNKCAWFYKNELEVIGSLPELLARGLAHPFGKGRSDVEKFFGKDLS